MNANVKRRKVIWLFACAAVLLMIAGLGFNYFGGANIELPAVEQVTSIEMAYSEFFVGDTDAGGTRQRIAFADFDHPMDISNIMRTLSAARMHNRRGASNDSPLIAEPYLQVYLYDNEMLLNRLYLYIRNGQGYVFNPYIGLYTLDQNVIRELMRYL